MKSGGNEGAGRGITHTAHGRNTGRYASGWRRTGNATGWRTGGLKAQKAHSPRYKWGAAHHPLTMSGLKAQKAHSPGQAKRHPGLRARHPPHALKGQKHKNPTAIHRIPENMLLPFQGAITRGALYPGRCPGLGAGWAFSPPPDKEGVCGMGIYVPNIVGTARADNCGREAIRQ